MKQRTLAPLLLGILAAGSAAADPFHAKNILIGERAAGLGGAFTAISDDPSGLYYNPAGLVFANENYWSLSAHAFSLQKQVYRNVWPGKDYTYTSSTLIPSFFGLTQSIGRHKLGFAILVPQSDLFDQDEELTGISDMTDKAYSLRRRFFLQDTTYLVGPGAATEVLPNLTVGVSVLGAFRTEKYIDQQLILFNPVGTGRYVSQTASMTRSAYGLLPKLGIQYMPAAKWSLGLTVSKNFTLGGSGSYTSLLPKTTNGFPVAFNGSFNNEQQLTKTKVDYDMQQPLRVDFGSAFFASRAWLVTADLNYAGADAKYPDYRLQAIVNWSVGSEYYLSESFAMRGGVYSNRANTAEVVTGGRNQLPHVNQLGASMGLSFFRPGTSVTISGALTRGSGKGQAIAESTAIQEISESGAMLYVAGSYQL